MFLIIAGLAVIGGATAINILAIKDSDHRVTCKFGVGCTIGDKRFVIEKLSIAMSLLLRIVITVILFLAVRSFRKSRKEITKDGKWGIIFVRTTE